MWIKNCTAYSESHTQGSRASRQLVDAAYLQSVTSNQKSIDAYLFT